MLIGLLIAASGVQAAVRPALTRIVALESDKETPIKLINDDKNHDYLVQSWIEDQQGNDKGLPLILTPPLFKISAGREGRLRMVILPGKYRRIVSQSIGCGSKKFRPLAKAKKINYSWPSVRD